MEGRHRNTVLHSGSKPPHPLQEKEDGQRLRCKKLPCKKLESAAHLPSSCSFRTLSYACSHQTVTF